jgi:adenosylcobinamide kinase / adenosylcobinamide-phosphate guanylyltransferase
VKETTLVIGGCKSGKSRHALELAEGYGLRKIFMATCIPMDDEMKERVARHKAERDGQWRTLDVPTELPEAVAEHGRDGNVILVDCLTLWITNLLMQQKKSGPVADRVAALVTALAQATCPVVLVSNEVGAGIVPENRLARQFRDEAGIANQKVAAAVDRVVWMVAGIANVVKGRRL